MLELSQEQVAAFAEIDARGYVAGMRDDLVRDDHRLKDDSTLGSRLWTAFVAARALGIRRDEHVDAFLRFEAYAPGFYKQPTTRNWLSRPGRTPDQRFHDYQRVVRWKIEHPEFVEGATYGGSVSTSTGGRSGGAWAGLGARWRRLAGRSGNGGNG